MVLDPEFDPKKEDPEEAEEENVEDDAGAESAEVVVSAVAVVALASSAEDEDEASPWSSDEAVDFAAPAPPAFFAVNENDGNEIFGPRNEVLLNDDDENAEEDAPPPLELLLPLWSAAPSKTRD